jgi:hypothetical protein
MLGVPGKGRWLPLGGESGRGIRAKGKDGEMVMSSEFI